MKAYRFIVTAIAFILALLSVVALSLGWFATYKPIDPAIGFSAGNLSEFEAYKLQYSDDTGALTSDITTPIDSIGAPMGSSMKIRDLQFGRISNLSTLENSNYIYYAVKIPKDMGGSIQVGISFDEGEDLSHFKIYVPRKANGDENETDAEGNIVVEEYTDAANLAQLEQLETVDLGDLTKNETFVAYSYVASENAPNYYDTVDKMNTLFADTEMSSLSPIDSATNLPMFFGTSYFDTSAVTGDHYYVYIKLQPNLELYSGFIDYLWDRMPFCLSYDVRVYFSVSTYVEETTVATEETAEQTSVPMQ